MTLFPQPKIYGSLLATLAIGLPVAGVCQDTPEGFDKAKAVFAKHCLKCHGSEKQRGGFRLDSSDSVFSPADSGRAPITKLNAGESELFQRITSTDPDFQMPRKGERLSDSEVEAIRQWINTGADWPEADIPPPTRGSGEMRVTEVDRQHWSFKPLLEVAPPKSNEGNPIDYFVHERLREAGLESNAQASTKVLIRRIHFDVLGLPPAPEHLVKNDSSANLDWWIDDLLSKRAFGENWARKWLDVVRYADSRGYEGDADEPNAYQYRDFVIRAINDDLPFDEFARWQIAGDELAPENPAAITATGFLAVGTINIPTPVAAETEHL